MPWLHVKKILFQSYISQVTRSEIISAAEIISAILKMSENIRELQ